MSIKTLKIRMGNPAKKNLMIVKTRFTFSSNSSMVSSLSVIVLISAYNYLRYARGTKQASTTIKKTVKVIAKGKYKI